MMTEAYSKSLFPGAFTENKEKHWKSESTSAQTFQFYPLQLLSVIHL